MAERSFDRNEPTRASVPGPFKLYPEERHWWSFNDYGAVLDVMRRLQPATVLEFGPGSSTLALIEGGAAHIDTCEDQADWAATYEERLMRQYPGIVELHRYTLGDPLTIPVVDDRRYDLALIDGPRGTDRRPPVVEYCLARCRAVLTPTEDVNPKFRRFLKQLAADRALDLEIMETGPLSGGFALLTPRVSHASPGEHAERSGPAVSEPITEARDVTSEEILTHDPPELETPEVPPLSTPDPALRTTRARKKSGRNTKRP